MKNFKKKVINIEDQEFAIFVKEVSPESHFTLFVPGFRSLAANSELLLNSLGSNCITFDFPGIRSNAHIKKFKTFGYRTDEIVDYIVEELKKKFEINIIICASLTTPYILSKHHEDKNTKLILMSPQFQTTFIDYILLVYCYLSLYLHKLTKKNVYRYMDKVLLGKVWMKILDHDTVNPKTTEILELDLQTSHSPWTEYQFISLFKYKKKSLQILKKIIDISDVYILVGNKDQLVNLNMVNSYINHIPDSKKNLIVLGYNHILEIEAYLEVAKLCESLG